MNRIMVIGCCGAGKSTLARHLHQRLSLPLYHLDHFYWNPGWIETEAGAWTETVRELADRDQWIIDGNYNGTMDIRLARADTVIFMDMPRRVCLYRVLKRNIQYFGRRRPDMGPGCPERIDLEFLHYVFFFHQKKRPKILEKLRSLPTDKSVITLRRQFDVDRFLDRW